MNDTHALSQIEANMRAVGRPATAVAQPDSSSAPAAAGNVRRW
jgi:hypothetical protein